MNLPEFTRIYLISHEYGILGKNSGILGKYSFF